MSQQKENFVDSVENAMRFFEGTPAAFVPDFFKISSVFTFQLSQQCQRNLYAYSSVCMEV